MRKINWQNPWAKLLKTMIFVSICVLTLGVFDQLYCGGPGLEGVGQNQSISECTDSSARKYPIKSVYNSALDRDPVILMNANLPYLMQIVEKDGTVLSVEVFSPIPLPLKHVTAVCLLPFQRTLGSSWNEEKVGDPTNKIVEIFLTIPN